MKMDTLGDLLSNCSDLCNITVNSVYRNNILYNEVGCYEPLFEGLAGNVPTSYHDFRLVQYECCPQRIVACISAKMYKYVFVKEDDRGEITIGLIAESREEAWKTLAETVSCADAYFLDEIVDVMY